MSLSANLADAIRDGITEDSRPKFVIVTQEQYDAIREDAMRRDIVRTPPPWGGKGSLTASTLGVPVLIREVGASIVDVALPVLDVRGIG